MEYDGDCRGEICAVTGSAELINMLSVDGFGFLILEGQPSRRRAYQPVSTDACLCISIRSISKQISNEV